MLLTGGFRSAGAMAAALRDGVDVVGLARPLTVDADLPRKLIDRSASASTVRSINTGRRRLDAIADIAWHTQQMHLLAAGRAPERNRSPWRALGQAVAINAVHTLRRHRPGRGVP